ncbi:MULTISPECIES: hypothetical protein [unclassified Shinella]|jgi:hypothetical protein|uniref:hypothetical protein n=1 Tax=unclassified Shinella TaxID=2643062 RepID=UPI0003C5607A|nr:MULTISPECIES: hypothetical protein [unclassified Shinella]MCA0340135.1 hypothetical protein [Pseudomonadota bacterium]EYR84360.1 hypothetical protein SHLA_61c000180 [Shinella sp. DD12]MCO5151456.1 hypothetical protein [Shinella sp.]MDC7266063.1 hypothetical protein [Shinella sp. HY16]MDC7272960.1 hypothetical protein [Shinella sp. YZ44]
MTFDKTRSHALKTRPKWTATIVLAMAMSTALGACAQAGDAGKPKVQTKSVYLVKYWVGNEVRYRKNPRGQVMKISAADYLNNSLYVCTPSGFGQKARCRGI